MREILKHDASSVTTCSTSVSWRPKETRRAWSTSLDQEIAKATPAASVLIEWAAAPQNHPPSEWWDATDDPFAPDPYE